MYSYTKAWAIPIGLYVFTYKMIPRESGAPVISACMNVHMFVCETALVLNLCWILHKYNSDSI